MKNFPIGIMAVFFAAAGLFIAHNALYSKADETAESKCSVTAFLNDPDTGGTNARDVPGGRIVKQLPLANDPKYEEGVYVNIKKSKDGWMQIESVENADASYRNLWVSGKLLGVGTRNYDNRPLGLYEKPDRKSRIVSYIGEAQVVSLLACSGKWLYVRGKGKNGKTVKGWLDPEMSCSSAITNCC